MTAIDEMINILEYDKKKIENQIAVHTDISVAISLCGSLKTTDQLLSLAKTLKVNYEAKKSNRKTK